MHNNKLYYYKINLVSTCIILAALILLSCNRDANKSAIVKQMPFATEVEATGEIFALKFETINIPEIIRNRDLRIYWLKITDLVAEGTVVKKGDFIATLEANEVESRLKSTLEELGKANNSYESALLDSTLKLSQLRDEITNKLDNLKEIKIQFDQSKYESKAIQRQNQINYQKAQIQLNSAQRNYEKEIQRQKVRIKRYKKRVEWETEMKDMYESTLRQLRIVSPSDGMVVYGTSWNGKKIKVGDEVGRWQPLIATIPDLNSLYSEAIVKEIDIAKIKVGQKVNIKIDAFPEKAFEGEVLSIANIGQPIAGAGMNGFKVNISINQNGEKILPSMTTSNKIVVSSFEKSLVVPRQAIFYIDSSEVVFLVKGRTIIQTKVETGGENETHMRIIKGLKEGDKVLLNHPQKYEIAD